MANDPSQNVHADLLPHVHLLSTYRYPSMPRLDLAEVHRWLLGAPKIARDTAPFFWTYLDAPKDNTIYLTWQPLSRRGTEFASDGYIWASGETYYQQDVGNGLVLEIFFQRCGYRIGEPAAVHSRRRFRLTAPQGAAPNAPPPQVDPSLWIVHYGPAEKNDRLPVHMIQITPHMQQILNFRQQLLSFGQIVRKEFMLSDRVNWPHIPLPGRGNSMYAPPINVRGVPQAMAYPPQGPAAVPPGKRRGGQVPPQVQGHHQHVIGAAPSFEAYDDEEDNSRGDLFDHLSPREISMSRFQQNHEWMEEILSSPYRIGQIVAPDLGLGLKGELASLTHGIFEAQGSDALSAVPKKPYVGHLDPGLADEFRKRVSEKVEATKTEIEKLKADHAATLQRMKGNAVIKRAEADLRFSVQDTGPEIWRLEGREEDGAETTSRRHHGQNREIEDILADVEAILGKHAVAIHEVSRVQDGGYQEPLPEPAPEFDAPLLQIPAVATDAGVQSGSLSRELSHNGSQNSGIMVGDSDVDMGGTAAGLLDQMQNGFSSTSTPVNSFPTPQPQLSAMGSAVGTPQNQNEPSPQPATAATGETTATTNAPVDTNMEDAGPPIAETTTVPDQGTDSGDWVVVPKDEGHTKQPSPNKAAAAVISEPPQTTAIEPSVAAPDKTEPVSATSKPASAVPTPGGGGSAFDGDQNDFSSLGDLDTAGDALADYDPPSVDVGTGDDLGEGLDLNMDMEDSAFGDAFHGVQHSSGISDRGSAGETPADGTNM
ncbi:hypothetical protein VTK73DRAFT_9513 [Phialemonium thermophilum]|uniref:DUF1750-domain-containing protein n=1 Tax=Phialemonium thermophilum TaxID=223376 RepID=A0ABR3Y4B5_9PEZI